MFKSIWKGIKWFFSLPDESKTKITRKHNHAHLPAVDKGYPIKVQTAPTAEPIVEIYNEMMDFYNNYTSGKKMDGVEGAKRFLWQPHRIQEAHKEHILSSCGFQKTHRQDGKDVYDPRLIHVINYAMNMQATEARRVVKELLTKAEKS
jgi:hypothetical protein